MLVVIVDTVVVVAETFVNLDVSASVDKVLIVWIESLLSGEEVDSCKKAVGILDADEYPLSNVEELINVGVVVLLGVVVVVVVVVVVDSLCSDDSPNCNGWYSTSSSLFNRFGTKRFGMT